MHGFTLAQRFGAEFLGTAFLLAAIVGSGIAADQLAGGNIAVALLCNALATGAALVVLITMFGEVSGAHFNPAVTLAFALRGESDILQSIFYVAAQIAGAVAGVMATHIMFDHALLQSATTTRTGIGIWASELIATFGLVAVIILTLRTRAEAVAMSVGLYISAAIWFTSSTSFANPAVTIGRALTDTFTGIRPQDVVPFIAAQIVGAIIAVLVCWALAARAQQESAIAEKERVSL